MTSKDRFVVDVAGMREALNSLSHDDKQKVREFLDDVMTEDRWREIHRAVRDYPGDKPYSLRQAVPDITEEEEEFFEFITQFFEMKQ